MLADPLEYYNLIPLGDFVDVEQGSPEWLALRKKKITATDANIIMGASHWKTRSQLYKEKTTDTPPDEPNERMIRGTELEPIARSLFALKMGVAVSPRVIVRDWAMASLDGISDDLKVMVEIKCPGEKDHSVALHGKVPEHYYPQLQHQMYVTGLESMYYFSFDGVDGVVVPVKRDQAYIEKMIEEEYKFYQCMVNMTAPEPDENDYLIREDDIWVRCAKEFSDVQAKIKELIDEEEQLRNQLIFLSSGSNCKGGGVSLCMYPRKGNIEYAKIPELKGVDLEAYRKPSSPCYKITCHS